MRLTPLVDRAALSVYLTTTARRDYPEITLGYGNIAQSQSHQLHAFAYLLRIGSLKGKKGMFQGVFREIKRGVAIVELRPLQDVTGTVKKREAPVERYRLFVVGPGASTAKRAEATSGSPRVYTARVEDGKFTVHVPVGTCRFVVGTVDGKIHEHEYAVTEAEGPVSHQIQLR